MVYLLYCNYYYFILYMFESDTPVFVNIILKNDILEKHFTISVTKYNSLRTSYCYTNIVILLICKVPFFKNTFFYASFYSMSFFLYHFFTAGTLYVEKNSYWSVLFWVIVWKFYLFFNKVILNYIMIWTWNIGLVTL